MCWITVLLMMYLYGGCEGSPVVLVLVVFSIRVFRMVCCGGGLVGAGGDIGGRVRHTMMEVFQSLTLEWS